MWRFKNMRKTKNSTFLKSVSEGKGGGGGAYKMLLLLWTWTCARVIACFLMTPSPLLAFLLAFFSVLAFIFCVCLSPSSVSINDRFPYLFPKHECFFCQKKSLKKSKETLWKFLTLQTIISSWGSASVVLWGSIRDQWVFHIYMFIPCVLPSWICFLFCIFKFFSPTPIQTFGY